MQVSSSPRSFTGVIYVSKGILSRSPIHREAAAGAAKCLLICISVFLINRSGWRSVGLALSPQGRNHHFRVWAPFVTMSPSRSMTGSGAPLTRATSYRPRMPRMSTVPGTKAGAGIGMQSNRAYPRIQRSAGSTIWRPTCPTALACPA
jgi:hypothetical protein